TARQARDAERATVVVASSMDQIPTRRTGAQEALLRQQAVGTERESRAGSQRIVDPQIPGRQPGPAFGNAPPNLLGLSSLKVETWRSAKSLFEPRVVACGSEVVVPARLLAERREQLDGPPEVVERLVAGVARKRCEARIVVMEARVVRHVLEATADRFERLGVALFAVGRQRLSVERPSLTPVERLIRLAGRGAEREDRSVPG